MRRLIYVLLLAGGTLMASNVATAGPEGKVLNGWGPVAGKIHSVVYQQDWRFRFHNGTWWYWLPSNRWVFWSNGQWVDYDPNNYGYATDYGYDSGYGYNPGYSTGYRGYGGYGYGGYGGVIIGGGHHHHGGGYHGGGHSGGHHGGGHHGGGHHGGHH